jgi:hypothetical protein
MKLPRVVGTSPPDGFQKAYVYSAVILIFSEPIDPNSDYSSFRLSQGYDNPIPGNISISGTDLMFSPASGLIKGATYTATFNGDVSDLAGNTAHINHSWSFRADYFKPVSVYPSAYSGCMPIDVVMTIECPAPVDESTVAHDMITVTCGDDHIINGTVSVDGRFVLFTPDTPLAPMTEHVAEVKPGIKTTDGQGMLGLTLRFSTRAENLLPLAIGNKWVYDVWQSNTYQETKTYIDSIVIVRDTVIDEKIYFLDQRGRHYRWIDDTIEMDFLTAYYYSGYHPFVVTLVNENCSYFPSVVQTDLGGFVCQRFRFGLLPASGLHYIEYHFAPDVGPVTFWRHCSLGGIGNYEVQTWTLIRYELQ